MKKYKLLSVLYTTNVTQIIANRSEGMLRKIKSEIGEYFIIRHHSFDPQNSCSIKSIKRKIPNFLKPGIFSNHYLLT
jgi:hypothetical protein